jgi:pimeloyl-ACP methyl ester carboxylesterase
MADFLYDEHRISYEITGEGDRPIVLIHGLLMNRRMYDMLTPELAGRGNRVITVDLLGHGESDAPEDMHLYSMTAFANQVVALLDHLNLDEAVVGGTSLGANVSLEMARNAPERVRAMFLEMPVLDNALLAVAVIFTPIMVALRFGRPLMEVTSQVVRRLPRTHYLVDILLDWARRPPGASTAILEGLFLGRAGPKPEERRAMRHPALIVGHHVDPLHPFSDSGLLAEEMPNGRLIEANSLLEWRIAPDRLNDALAEYLDEVWTAAGSQGWRRAASGVAAS